MEEKEDMLKEKLMEDLKESMRTKNELRKNVVQMIRAAILQVEKDKQIELDDNQILEIISKESKKRKDSLPDYERSGRQDLIQNIKEEIKIISEYLPKELTEEEYLQIVKQAIEETGAKDIKDMGMIMKLAKEKCGPAADGKTINEIAKKLLA